jgi:hypothetical protein
VKAPLPQLLLRQFLSRTWKSSITNGAVSIKKGSSASFGLFSTMDGYILFALYRYPSLTWHSVCMVMLYICGNSALNAFLWRLSFPSEWSLCVQVERIVYITKDNHEPKKLSLAKPQPIVSIRKNALFYGIAPVNPMRLLAPYQSR